MTEDGLFDKSIEEWQAEREVLNEKVLGIAGLEIKRFFSLDGQTYRAGALPAKTKELLGFVASLVLRCDDCILYHTIKCKEEGVSTEEFQEACSVGLIVGGSIVIPHLRRAAARWAELDQTSPKA
jgi:AhpD family alkylhydroperoxidase